MTERHAEGWIDDAMPVQSSQGAFAAIAGINRLVNAHCGQDADRVKINAEYADGKLDQPMDRLPGKKEQIPTPSNRVQARLKAAATEAVQNLRLRNALDRCSTNVMIANSANEIVYMNDTVTEMMGRNEAELRKTLPQFDARRLIGQSIDVFHKNPAHQRSLLSALRTTYSTQIKVGELTFALVASPIIDERGGAHGHGGQWADRTAKVAVESKSAGWSEVRCRATSRCVQSKKARRASLRHWTKSVNQLMGTSEVGLNGWCAS
ncbi:MAG: hypothetical protein IPM01_28750 [Burkholderiaceae bacterium]|nr:hypothetical protein [Burkholderiaceae bacterium]